jgi:DNA relaxase NicK
MALAREYICDYIRLVWDAPSNSFVVSEIGKNKDEAYWRLYMKAGN